ncbi:hypothetical protein [Aliikangiella sp. IMCC44359]|uniref:hypothetical protein n=1 Tax=Aliikangiella sp. IMCC44359 TaxID=3459125 RepID=UPI00403AFA92
MKQIIFVALILITGKLAQGESLAEGMNLDFKVEHCNSKVDKSYIDYEYDEKADRVKVVIFTKVNGAYDIFSPKIGGTVNRITLTVEAKNDDGGVTLCECGTRFEFVFDKKWDFDKIYYVQNDRVMLEKKL